LFKPDVAIVPDAAGEPIASSSLTVPAKGQLSKLGAELFGNVSAAGWVQITSTTSGLQGFWIGGDFATYTDGADAAAVAVDLVFPLVAGQTEINIANLAPAGATATGVLNVTLRLLGLNGVELGTPVPKMVGRLGAYQAKVSELFPSADLSQAAYIRASGSSGA